MASTSAPSARRDLATASPFSASREPITTLTPCLPSWRAVSRPMPRFPPVINATLVSVVITIAFSLSAYSDVGDRDRIHDRSSDDGFARHAQLYRLLLRPDMTSQPFSTLLLVASL